MLEINKMTYKLPKGRTILNELDLVIWPGEFLGVLGKNGAGKTTLLDLIMGIRPVTDGEIKFMEHDPQFLPPEVSENIVFLSQDIKIPSAMSIQDYLDYMSFYYKNYSKQREKELLKYFDMDPKAKIGSLSTGQQKKAQIISGLSVKAKLIIIDEITAVLDPESRLKFFKVLQAIHQKKEQSIILATNIAEDLVGRVDRIVFLSDGKVSYHTTDDLNKIFDLEEIA